MPQKTRLKDTFIVVKVQPIPHTLNSNQRCFEIPFHFDFGFDFDSSSQKLKQNKASLPTVQCKQLVKSKLYTLPFFTSPNPFSSSSSNSPSLPRMKDHYSSMDEDPSSKNDALTTTLKNSIQALGRGFDVTSDIRLLYCKGAPGSRLIYLDDQNTKELVFSDDGFVAISNVPVDVEFSTGERTTEATPVCSFYEMAKYFNMKSNLAGDVPLGNFNAMFNFTGSWQLDAASTKSLAMIGYIVPLFEVRLEITDLVLLQEVKRAVPYSWDPASLASFIENYGTHIVTSATVGGRDVVYIKQHQSSPLSLADIDNYVKDIGEHRFFDLKGQSSSGPLKYKDKDVTVIFRRRGGDDLEQSHAKWAETVETAPDVINMTFTPIVSLLDGVPGIKHLTRAIELYLEYKPPIEDLQYFLEFQISRVWAPEQSNIQRKEPVCPSLQFSLMGPKLYISLEQVTIGRKPVTGLRLSLEGSKQNRLAIHIQHLVSLPKILQPHWDTHMAIGAPKWQGPEEQDSRWFEPIKWKNFSHVSTAPIEHTETYIGDLSGVHIVTGAQFGVWDFGARSVLHLKLLFSKVPGCTIRRSVWDHSPANLQRAGDDKGDGSSQSGKLAKIVDMTEMSKGPQDVPGHWLVTGAKLGVDKGRIVLRIKYSLLNY